MKIHGNKLELNAGETIDIEVYHADGYYKDVNAIDYNPENKTLTVEIM